MDSFESIAVFTVTCDPEYATEHGVCKISETVTLSADFHEPCLIILLFQGEFAKIIHKGDMDQVKNCIRPDNRSDIVSGVCSVAAVADSLPLQLAGLVYFNQRVLGTLLSLHTMPPLDACTYVGLDNGAEPLAVSPNSLMCLEEIFIIPSSAMFVL